MTELTDPRLQMADSNEIIPVFLLPIVRAEKNDKLSLAGTTVVTTRCQDSNIPVPRAEANQVVFQSSDPRGFGNCAVQGRSEDFLC